MNFYKVTNKNEKHNEMQYKTGLNVDIQPFNPSGDCESGGIYFSREDILAFLDCGCWIRKVTLPKDANIYENPGTPKKWKADRVILGRKYKITPKVIQRLIDEGADIHANNDYALCYASGNGHTEIVKLLLENDADIHADDDDSLCWASINGHTKTVKILLENGANVHADDDCALCFASEYGYIETVKLLLENGANIHAGNDYALRCASKYGHTKTVKILLENGANVHADDDYALCFAFEYGHTETVKLLKEWVERENK